MTIENREEDFARSLQVIVSKNVAPWISKLESQLRVCGIVVRRGGNYEGQNLLDGIDCSSAGYDESGGGGSDQSISAVRNESGEHNSSTI
jgi:hypothetical protein